MAYRRSPVSVRFRVNVFQQRGNVDWCCVLSHEIRHLTNLLAQNRRAGLRHAPGLILVTGVTVR